MVRTQSSLREKPVTTSKSTRSFLGTSLKTKFDSSTNRKSSRTLTPRTDLQNRPLPVALRLRAQKVSQKTLHRYLQEIEEFKGWLQQRKLAWSSKRLDALATRYITHLQETEKREVHQATYFVYGMQLLHCDGPKAFFLPNTKQALSGWKCQNPGRMRLPLPEEVIFDLACQFSQADQPMLAMAILLQMHCYLRPSECIGLTRDNVCFPAKGRYRKWGLIIAPQALGVTTKTGHFEDSVLIGDTGDTNWISQLFALYMKKVSDELFPGLTLAKYEQAITQMACKLNYSPGSVTPHVFRHTGPSNDFFHRRRDLHTIQKRGRWLAKSSVRRYEKSSLLIKRWEVVAEARKQVVASSSQMLPSLFKSALNHCDRF